MVELELGQKILSKTSLVGKLQDKSAPRLTRVPESEKYIQKSKSILLQNIMQTKTDPDNSPEKLPFYEHKRSISALRMPPSERSLLKSSLRHISPMGARNISPLSSRRHKSPNHSPSTMEKIQDNLTVCKGVAFYSMNAFPIYQGLWNATGKPKRSMSNGRPSAKTDRSYANF